MLDESLVEGIVNNLFNAIKEDNTEKSEVSISIRRKFDEKAVNILQIKRVRVDQLEKIKKILPGLIFLLVKDAKPHTIFTRYSFH